MNSVLELFNSLGPTPKALVVGVVIVLVVGGTGMLFKPESEERKDARLKATYAAYYGTQAKEASDREWGYHCIGWDGEDHSFNAAAKGQLEELGIKDLKDFVAELYESFKRKNSQELLISLSYSVTNSSGVRVSTTADIIVDVETCETTLVKVE